ncbi:two-component sensor histidine kinase [Zobellella endophytica]|uniref:Sensor protein n=1 Tax=Zobellella endophytica TaxID=2116700 RepID=A0A2P7R8B2_9GAMM|nr:heavy metal sensor histidine kinase [Zobellella endophytica]PSJ46441.1 two-component sensor histidine kinase [Zobellella endophytica]
MRSYFSLTARLSLLFSITMLGIWSLVSIVLMQSLEHHFARQDEADIRGKLILAKNFLATHLQSNGQNWSLLEEHLNDALSGHGGHYLLIRDVQGRTLANARPNHRRQPGMTRPFPPPASLPLSESWAEDGIRYRSITEQIFFEPPLPWPDAPESVLIRAALDTSNHQHFIDEIQKGLAWFTGGIALVSVLLGWFASRIGLKPLRTLASLSSRVTADKLNHRLPLHDAPAELHTPIQAFNAMLDRLEDSFRRLSEFSSDIAHELRTPVNSLMMQTQVALSRERSADDYREALYNNLETAERLARMIGEMLFLAKSEQGQLLMQAEELELATELDELLEFFEPLASEQQLRLHRRGNATLQGDRAMLQRAFSNLLTNAIRYTPAQGEIRIEVKRDASHVVVEIANPGNPIPAEQLPRLFDRFYRADSARQPVTEGTGLGLSIAKAIIEAHGGSLSARSDEHETCFSACFPRTARPKRSV